MTERRLDVLLDGILCGILAQSPTGDLTFRYDDDYRRRDRATPLSLSMPLAAATHRKRVALPFFAGLLPDNLEALAAVGRRYGVSPRNPFALLEHVGADVAGAVQIVATGSAATDRDDTRERLDSLTERDVAILLDHVVAEYREGTPFSDVTGQFSLAGGGAVRHRR